MHSRWMNTNVSTAAEMLEVTDKMILEMSNGEVMYPAPYEETDPYQGSMTDSAIFGKMDSDEALMGHLQLPVPIVNIQYFFGTRPVLPRLLGIPRRDLESIVYYSSYVVVDPGDSDAVYKQIIPIDDAPVFLQSHPGAILKTGAEAVSYLLMKEDINKKDYIVLHMLPVIPVSLRYGKITCKDHKESWAPYSIEFLYDRLIFRKNRLIKLKDLKAPDVILLNEKRVFQEYVDSLISNGAHGMPVVLNDGYPSDSLQELYEMTSVMSADAPKPVMPAYEPVDTEEIWKRMQIICSSDEDEGENSCEAYDLNEDSQVVAEKEILAMLRPFVDAVLQDNFPQYVTDYHDLMCQFAEHSISHGLDDLVIQKPAEPQLLNGIVRTVRLGMKKQGMYL